MKDIGIFLDRDGTIIKEVNYLADLSGLEILPRSVEAIRLINREGIKAILVTNQGGVAKGYFPEGFVVEVHKKLELILKDKGAHLDAIYYCPHHPEGIMQGYRIVCECRKPKPGMLKNAANKLNLDLSRSYVVGDRASDIQLANNIGAKGVLVLTGYGDIEKELLNDGTNGRASYIAADLYSAAEWIISDIHERL